MKLEAKLSWFVFFISLRGTYRFRVSSHGPHILPDAREKCASTNFRKFLRSFCVSYCVSFRFPVACSRMAFCAAESRSGGSVHLVKYAGHL